MRFMQAVCLAACPLAALSAGIRGAGYPHLSMDDIKDPCPFGYGAGCSGGKGRLDAATKAKVANILEGILKNLSNKKGLVQETEVVSRSSGMDGETASQTVDLEAQQQVQSILKSVAQQLHIDTTEDPCPFGYGDNCGSRGDRELDSATKAQVASILEGILKNLSKKQ
mmetsp:Transcript_51342/g.121968  ORF Transcript_51342/g.121968 Transcript_51342/m.121968 type:complete len:168 (-) Transcript_51342:98-601(-)|eukprot:CAMPEP_0178402782 /NCGR_PEP_ID=MMETSP0689_2-20121128/17024_1 /TAXON_ID=160604 /ORGANISM="Amphidinium massartii, Strain CS-259" /LENGTH=167 /DNA_ID=CAMNT_0020023703 /DNA_START=66 /DNA_END=569 /DNA_ORIENTATION=+